MKNNSRYASACAEGVNLSLNFSIEAIFRERASGSGSADFLIIDDGMRNIIRYSYQEAWQKIAIFSENLRSYGVQQGSLVALRGTNSAEWVFAFMACQLIGAVALLINTKLTCNEVKDLFEISDPQFLIDFLSDPETFYYSRAVSINIDNLWTAVRKNNDVNPDVMQSPLSPAAVVFTSGTSGKPKGVVLTKANLVFGAWAAAKHASIMSSDVGFLHLPLFHINSLIYSLLASVYGGSSIVLASKFSASHFWSISVRNRCTWSCMVAFCINAMKHIDVPKIHFYDRWAWGLADRDVDTRYRIKTISWYGMSETVAQPIFGGTYHGHDVPGVIGLPADEYEVRVVSSENEICPPGVPGNLQIRGIRGISIFSGYMKNMVAPFSADGWFITGDIVSYDSDGYIRFFSRGSDLMRISGENVACREIEMVLGAHPKVVEVHVVGIPHDIRGEVPVVAIIPDSPVDEDRLRCEILELCEKSLASFKLPQSIFFVKDVPRIGVGRVNKARLREFLTGL